jgi:hypothetical protein
MKPEKNEVRCCGRIVGTSKRCGETVFQTDGEFLMAGGSVANPEYAT